MNCIKFRCGVFRWIFCCGMSVWTLIVSCCWWLITYCLSKWHLYYDSFQLLLSDREIVWFNFPPEEKYYCFCPVKPHCYYLLVKKIILINYKYWKNIIETFFWVEKWNLLINTLKDTIKVKIYETLGKIPEILKPQVIFFLQLRRWEWRSFNGRVST